MVLKRFLENQHKPYNLMLILGRNLEAGLEMPPELLLGVVDIIEKRLRWTPVEDFFRLFPPVKRYANDDTWDYQSTKNMIEKDLGSAFGKDDFKMLLMTSCYENRYLENIGFAWMEAVSDIKMKFTGTGVMESFLQEQGIPTSTI